MTFKSNVLEEIRFSTLVFIGIWLFGVVMYFDQIGLLSSVFLFCAIIFHILFLLLRNRVVSVRIEEEVLYIERIQRLKKSVIVVQSDKITVGITERRTFRGYQYFILSISTSNEMIQISGRNQGWSNEQIVMIEEELKLKKL
jgi:hypothetical protein